MKLKSAALSGGLLDYFTAKALGYASLKMHNGECYQIVTEHKKQPDESTVYDVSLKKVSPTSCADTFLSVLKTQKIGLEPIGKSCWASYLILDNKSIGDGFLCIYGASPEEVVFRAFVVKIFGEEIDYE